MIREITHAVSCAGSDSYVKIVYNDENNVFGVELNDAKNDYRDLVAVSRQDMERVCVETLATLLTIDWHDDDKEEKE